MNNLPGRLGSLQARHIMTDKVVVLSEDSSIVEAANTLIEQRISGAPVVDKDGVFVGLLSVTDLAHPRPPDEEHEHVSSESPSAIHTHADYLQWLSKAPQRDETELVRHRMSRRLVSVRETTSLVDVARVLCRGHWHRVAVVDSKGCICGIVSTMDVLAALVHTADEGAADVLA